ncbi:regulator of G protein-like protein [Tricladium varicosporioides]|nr:regulator of G protein-like protein [Hymenoscyphus varicosporioides]
MSILFYRRPDYLNKPNGPINPSDCDLYVERAKKSERIIPEGLSFEDIINKKTLPPCQLSDFMDYLIYVEHNAENLQFFLWYKDYCKRFDTLSEKDKALSPPWIPDTTEIPELTRDEKEKKWKSNRDAMAKIMDSGYDKKSPTFSSDSETDPSSPTLKKGGESSYPGCASGYGSIPTNAEVAAQAGLKWQPFTVQPFREEINRIMRHYLAFTAPRELNLCHKDRALCLHALQHTTHPTALLPAIKIAEAALRGQSHPNFIRWSICNGNRPRVFFVRTMGVSNILLGFLIAILLTLSKLGRWWRIFAAIEWFLGISTMICAYKGLCILMHFNHGRNLRPWEQEELDAELGELEKRSSSSTAGRETQMSRRTGHYEDSMKGGYGDENNSHKFSMNAFGPKNSFESASWRSRYEKKPILRKIFDKSVWTQDETLRILQDRIVLGANIWALIITIPLAAFFIALPKGNFY